MKRFPHLLSLVLTLCGLGLLTACNSSKELTVRTQFYEECREYMFSDDPDLFDHFDYLLCLEYPTSIVSSDGTQHEDLCQKIQRDILVRIFGEEDTQAAYDDKLPRNPSVREGEDRFVTLTKNLSMNRSIENRQEYVQQFGERPHGGKENIDPNKLVYFYEIYSFLSYNYGDIVSIHMHWSENEYGKESIYERGYNYDLKGNLLYEKDIFEEGWEEELAQLLTEEFERFPLTAEIPHFDPLIKPNGNFKLSPKGVIYMFDKGEIADAKYGTIRITLPWKKVNTLQD